MGIQKHIGVSSNVLCDYTESMLTKAFPEEADPYESLIDLLALINKISL